MRLVKVLCFFLGSIYASDFIDAQNTEDILWGSFQLNKKIDDKTSFSAKPILRQNQDFSNYANSSLDLFLKRNLGKGWSAQFLTRIWFMPNRSDRLFLWSDISYKTAVPSLQVDVTQRVRYHQALDIAGILDLDYIRYIIQLTPKKDWKVLPSIAYERWFILNDVEGSRLSRLQPAIKITIDDRTSLAGSLWRQLDRRPDESTFFQNLWIVNLSYNL